MPYIAVFIQKGLTNMKTIKMAAFEKSFEKEKLSIIDVRERDEYVLGHVPGAINMPLSTFLQEYQSLDRAVKHYLICQSGARSSQAAVFLNEKGYQVINVEGGTSAWTKELEK